MGVGDEIHGGRCSSRTGTAGIRADRQDGLRLVASIPGPARVESRGEVPAAMRQRIGEDHWQQTTIGTNGKNQSDGRDSTGLLPWILMRSMCLRSFGLFSTMTN